MSHNEIITLAPAVGDELELDGDVLLVTATDWGDTAHEVELAEGPEIVGAVPGARRRPPIQSTIHIQLDSPASGYLPAATALEDAVAALAEHGGVVRRRRRLPNGALTFGVESEVLNAELSDSDDFLLERELRLLRQPEWLGDWRQVAAYSGSDPAPEIALDGLRGQILGPGRITFTDGGGPGIRYAAIGQEWTKYDPGAPAPVLLPADDADGTDGFPTGAAGSISTNALRLSALMPAWRTIARFDGLPHRGLWVPTVRYLFNDADATAVMRLMVQVGGDQWRELDRREITGTAGEWRRLRFNPISRYAEAAGMSIAVQVLSPEVRGSTNLTFDALELLPAERYALLRGGSAPGLAAGIVDFDGFDQSPGDLAGKLTPVAANQWTVSGATGSGKQWQVATWLGEGVALRSVPGGSPDGTPIESGGSWAILTDPRAQVTVQAQLEGVMVTTTRQNQRQAMCVVARYSGTGSWLMAGFFVRVPNSGPIVREIRVWKRVGGIATLLASRSGVAPLERPDANTVRGLLELTVDTAGNWSLRGGPFGAAEATEELLSGTDSDLSSGGPLASGNYGVYHAQSGLGGTSSFAHYIAAYGDTTDDEPVYVVRPSGRGVHDHRESYSADAAGDHKQPVTLEGDRLWLPPGASRLVVVPRVGDAGDGEDEIPSGSSFSIEHRPAYTGLPDEVEKGFIDLAAELDNMGLWWAMDSITGVTDLSGNGRHGAPQFGVIVGGDPDSPLASGGGSTEFISGPFIHGTYDPFVDGTVRTFMGWAWRRNESSFHALFGSDVEIGFQLRDGGDVVLTTDFFNTTATWAGAWPGLQEWVFWALVHNQSAGLADLYINGQHAGQRVYTASYGQGDLQLAAGFGANTPFNGKMAHFIIVEGEVSAAEIAALYQGASVG